MTPLPRQPAELPDPICDSQPSNSNTTLNLTSATEKGKIAHFATKGKKYISETILTAHSENWKEKDTRTKTVS